MSENSQMTKKSRADSKAERLARRLNQYSAQIVRLTDELPDSKGARHIADQLLRSGTAVGAHYAEARNAQSGADFVHKLGLAAKEARESLYWLRVVARLEWEPPEVKPLLEDGIQLTSWLYSSLKTAREGQG